MRDALGYYASLEVSCDANIDVIKSKYRDLAKYWHPDLNTDEGALEKFQKISEAWDILSGEDSRQIYDLLSMVYNQHNYPDLENIVLLGGGKLDIRAVSLIKIRSWLWGYSEKKEITVVDYKQAVFKQMNNALLNWGCGWWHPVAFIKNIKAMYENWNNPVSVRETKRILIHNLVCCKLEGRIKEAKQFAVLALDYANDELKKLLHKFLGNEKLQYKPKKWNLINLRFVQLLVPLFLIFGFVLSIGSQYITEAELWQWFEDKKEINYYQEVNFIAGQSGVDDVVVGKVLNIPVDKKDMSRLYHLKENSEVMYGPGDDFDVLKNIKANTTVRLTGVTPDNVWSRIMIDNGEMGFVRTEKIVSGVGSEIPYGSKIFEK